MSSAERWATFDCYGTLIDWDRGIGDQLSRLFPGEDRGALLSEYHELEPEVQRGAAIPYREVMSIVLQAMADARRVRLPAGEEDALGASLPGWPPFPEVGEALDGLRRRGWRLGILSNTDPDLLAASIERIGVPVDLTVTAADAGSYKPELGHWRAFRERAMSDPERHVHVAQSAFHDLAPCAELEIPAVWVNRAGEESDLPRAAELSDLAGLGDALDRIVPA